MTPIFKGIGYAMFLMCTFVGIYYNMIVAWSIYYLYNSFLNLKNVPWSHCDNQWNTLNCLEDGKNVTGSVNETLSPSQEFF